MKLLRARLKLFELSAPNFYLKNFSNLEANYLPSWSRDEQLGTTSITPPIVPSAPVLFAIVL